MEKDSPPSLQTGWPHKDLLKDLDDIPPRKRKNWLQQHPPKVPMWMTDNVLPKLFFHFTYDLLFYGGVQSSYLDIKSIKKYTSIYQSLSTTTLTYDMACDPDALAQWAQDRYNATNENDKWLVYNFFRYLKREKYRPTMAPRRAIAASVRCGRRRSHMSITTIVSID